MSTVTSLDKGEPYARHTLARGICPGSPTAAEVQPSRQHLDASSSRSLPAKTLLLDIWRTYRAIGSAAGVAHTTVMRWRPDGPVPRRYHAVLIAAALVLGHRLTAGELTVGRLGVVRHRLL